MPVLRVTFVSTYSSNHLGHRTTPQPIGKHTYSNKPVRSSTSLRTLDLSPTIASYNTGNRPKDDNQRHFKGTSADSSVGTGNRTTVRKWPSGLEPDSSTYGRNVRACCALTVRLLTNFSVKRNATESPLLRLPTELRAHVFELALSGYSITISFAGPRKRYYGTHACVPKASQELP